jgi:hypothetical protein
VPIWVVRVGDGLYVRSYRGPSGSWPRRARRNGSGRIRVGGGDHAVRFTAADPAVRPQVDEAYRAKYGWYGSSYVRRIISDNIAETTLHLQPTISTQRPRAGAESRDLPLTDSPDSLCGRCWIAYCHSFEVDREPVRSSIPWRKTAV